MADALSFTLALADKFSGPAGKAALNVRRLTSDLLALRDAVASVQALGAVKLKVTGKVGAKATATGGLDPNATGAQQVFKLDPAKQARAAQKAAQQTARAEAAAQKAQQRDQQKAFRFAQKADNEIKKAQKLAQSNIDKKARVEASAQKKAAAAAERAAKKQKRSLESIAEADKAHAFVNGLADGLGALVNPATLAGVAVAALGAAFAYAAIQGGSLVLAATEAKGDTLDMLEAMLGSAEAADRTYATIRDLTRNFAISLGDAQGLAQSLTAAGITNEAQLKQALTAVAQVDSVIKGAGSKVEAIFQKAAQTGKFAVSTKQLVGTGVQLSALYEELAKRTGKGVGEIEKEFKAGKIAADVGIAALTTVIDKKFGKLGGKQALDFSAQVQRLKDNFVSLFDGVNTGPFLTAFSKIVALFDDSTQAGKALKQTVTGFFNAMFNAAAATLPYIQTLLRGLIIIGLRLFIAFKPLAKALGATFGGPAKTGPQDLAAAMSQIGLVLGQLTAKFVGLLTQKTVWEALTIAASLTGLAFRTIWAIVQNVVGTFTTFLSVGASVVTWLLDLAQSAYTAGQGLLTGLVNGILSIAPTLVETVRGIAGSAISAFKETFGIHSPSTVMAGMGQNLTAGLSQGLDASKGRALQSMSNVVDLGAYRAQMAGVGAGKQGAAAAGAGVTVQVTFAEGAVQIGGGMNQQQAKDLLSDAFVDALEQVGLANGTGEGVAA